MDIDTKIDNEEFSYTEKLGSSQALVECDINTVARGGLTKILTVSTDAKCIKVDTFDGEAKVYGKVTYKVLYLSENGELTSVEYSSDFVESIASRDILTTTTAYAMLSVEDVDSMAKGDSIRLQAVVDIVLLGIAQNSVGVVTSVDGALVKCKDIKTSIHICHIDTKCDVVEDKEIGANVETVLLLDGSVSVENIRPNKDSVDVIGHVSINILYRSEAKSVPLNMEVPFSESIKSLGVDDTSSVGIVASVDSIKCIIGGSEDNNIIRTEMTLRLEGDAYEYVTKSVVDDAISPYAKLDITRDDIMYTRLVGYKATSEKISGEASLSDGDSAIKKVITCIAQPNIMTNAKVDDGKVLVDGLIDVDIVYINEGDEYQVMRVELPESIRLNIDEAKAGDTAYIGVSVDSISAKPKRDRDMDIMVDVTIMASIVRSESVEVVTNVVKSEDIDMQCKCMGVYFVTKGENLWDIVKATYMSEAELRATNPDIDFDNIVGGERVLVYRCRK